jgi:hypothetical protein
MIFMVLAWSLAATAQAQPPRPDRPGPDHHPKPPATVVARVNVNVETDVDVANDAASAKVSEEEEEDDDDEDDDEEEGKESLVELVAALLRQPGAGSGVQVIADINVNVETRIKVRGSAKSAGPKPPGPPPPKAKPDTIEEKKPTPPAEDTPPRKKRKRKKAQQSLDTSGAEEKVEAPASLSLNRLKIGENLELGVTGQVGSDEKAKQIASRINAGKGQSLLGMALVGMMVPEEAESVRIIQQAISSVQADANGPALSVSVAIPKETPSAVKTIVEAALKKE